MLVPIVRHVPVPSRESCPQMPLSRLGLRTCARTAPDEAREGGTVRSASPVARMAARATSHTRLPACARSAALWAQRRPSMQNQERRERRSRVWECGRRHLRMIVGAPSCARWHGICLTFAYASYSRWCAQPRPGRRTMEAPRLRRVILALAGASVLARRRCRRTDSRAAVPGEEGAGDLEVCACRSRRRRSTSRRATAEKYTTALGKCDAKAFARRAPGRRRI